MRAFSLRAFALFLALSTAMWFAPPRAQADSPPRGYELILSPHDHAFRYTVQGEPNRRGKRAERFELRDGDCGGSDCGAPRYRSEIGLRDRYVDARIGKDIWYGWSFYNGTVGPTLRDTNLRLVFGQWRLSGDLPPVFRFIQMGRDEGNWSACDPAICTRSTDRTQDIVVQLADMADAYGWSNAQNDGHICRLFSIVEAHDYWMDIVVNTNFANDGSGYLRIWVNDQLKCDYRGQLVARLPDRGRAVPTHRRGVFASYTKRWDKTQPQTPKPRFVVYYDEFRTGTRREDVDPRWREDMNMRPED